MRYVMHCILLRIEKRKKKGKTTEERFKKQKRIEKKGKLDGITKGKGKINETFEWEKFFTRAYFHIYIYILRAFFKWID